MGTAVNTRRMFGRPVPRAATDGFIAVARTLFSAIAGAFGVDALAAVTADLVAVGIPVGDPFFGIADHVAEPVSRRGARADGEHAALFGILPLFGLSA